MPLGLGIVEALRAIPPRIEVAGHGPTVRVTGGSVEAVLDFVARRYGDRTVVAYERGGRLWPRVTLTVTCDAGLAATAPPLDELVAAAEAGPATDAAGLLADSPDSPAATDERDDGIAALRAMFDDQQQAAVPGRHAARIPQQRRGSDETAEAPTARR